MKSGHSFHMNKSLSEGWISEICSSADNNKCLLTIKCNDTIILFTFAQCSDFGALKSGNPDEETLSQS